MLYTTAGTQPHDPPPLHHPCSCWYLSSPPTASNAGGEGVVRLHRRYECRCYSGARPCSAGILPVAAGRAVAPASVAGEAEVVGGAEGAARALAER
jgi:hypothetical protein